MDEKLTFTISADTAQGRAAVKAFREEMSGLDKQAKDTTGMRRSMTAWEKLTTSAKTSAVSIKSSIMSIQGALIGLGATVSLAYLTRQFVAAASEAENYRVRLDALLGSTQEGARAFRDMAKYAGSVPFQYREVMGAATSLAGVLKGGVDEINQWMPFIGDLAAAAGLSLEETTGQVMRMFSAGAASADTFRERGVLAMLGFQAGVSYSVEETKQIMWNAWTATDSKFRGLTDNLAKTWTGLTSMLADKWFQFRVELMDSGAFDFVKASIQTIINKFDSLQKTGQFDAFARDMGQTLMSGMKGIMLGAALVGDAFRAWEAIWNSLKIVYGGFVLGIVTGVREVLRAMNWMRRGVGMEEIGLQFIGELEGIQAEWLNIVESSKQNLITLQTTVSNYEKAKILISEIEAGIRMIGTATAKVPALNGGTGGSNGIPAPSFWQLDNYAVPGSPMPQKPGITAAYGMTTSPANVSGLPSGPEYQGYGIASESLANQLWSPKTPDIVLGGGEPPLQAWQVFDEGMEGILGNLTDKFGLYQQALSGVGEAWGQIITGQASGAEAFKRLTLSIIASISKQSLVQALFEVAKGYAAAAVGDAAGATAHFTSAKFFGLTAAISGGAAAALSATGGGGGTSSLGPTGSAFNPTYTTGSSTNSVQSSQTQAVIDIANVVKSWKAVPAGQVVVTGVQQAGGLAAVTTDKDFRSTTSRVIDSRYV